MKPVETEAERRQAHVFHQGQGRLEVVGETRPGVKLEGEANIGIRGPLGRLDQTRREPPEVLRRKLAERVAGNDQHRNPHVAAEPQPALEGLPVLRPCLPLAREQASLKAGRHRRDTVAAERLAKLGDRPLGEKGIGMAEPEIHRIDMAGGVVFEDRLQGTLETRNGGERRPHTSRSRRRSTTSPMGNRYCTSESRSRSVTVWSASVWPSMVRHQGVPASSCRA